MKIDRIKNKGWTKEKNEGASLQSSNLPKAEVGRDMEEVTKKNDVGVEFEHPLKVCLNEVGIEPLHLFGPWWTISPRPFA